jgi:hypothetical protein
VEIYLSQYQKLLKEWERGLAVLKDEQREELSQLKIFAKAAYSHFKSDYLQTKFSLLKRNIAGNKEEIKSLIEQEKENAKELLDLIYTNACVGFEASNHYYYTDRNIIEKILLLSFYQRNI